MSIDLTWGMDRISAWTKRRIGNRMVGIFLNDSPNLLLGIGTADAKLVRDRSVSLVVTGAAGVKRYRRVASRYSRRYCASARVLHCV